MGHKKQPMDGDLTDSIAMLEQILEVMPQDSMALKALFNAYSQGGRRDRAFEYLTLIADVAHANDDREIADFVLDKMKAFKADYPAEVAAHLARLRTLILAEPQATPTSATSSSVKEPVTPSTEVDINEELALAWKLYEENQLSQEEYSIILNDLTEVSSKEINVPVSVLHVLNDRGFNQMSRIINYMSTRSGVPTVSLPCFELSDQVVNVLPLGIAAHDGALPFGFFGNDLMVAVLNPFNNALMDKVENVSGRRCHAYLVSPEDYDAALVKLRGLSA
jgi:tetratricopeptide (TPR) repeat protein